MFTYFVVESNEITRNKGEKSIITTASENEISTPSNASPPNYSMNLVRSLTGEMHALHHVMGKEENRAHVIELVEGATLALGGLRSFGVHQGPSSLPDSENDAASSRGTASDYDVIRRLNLENEMFKLALTHLEQQAYVLCDENRQYAAKVEDLQSREAALALKVEILESKEAALQSKIERGNRKPLRTRSLPPPNKEVQKSNFNDFLPQIEAKQKDKPIKPEPPDPEYGDVARKRKSSVVSRENREEKSHGKKQNISSKCKKCQKRKRKVKNLRAEMEISAGRIALLENIVVERERLVEQKEKWIASKELHIVSLENLLHQATSLSLDGKFFNTTNCNISHNNTHNKEFEAFDVAALKKKCENQRGQLENLNRLYRQLKMQRSAVDESFKVKKLNEVILKKDALIKTLDEKNSKQEILMKTLNEQISKQETLINSLKKECEKLKDEANLQSQKSEYYKRKALEPGEVDDFEPHEASAFKKPKLEYL